MGLRFTHLLLCAAVSKPDPVVRSNGRAYVVVFYLSAIHDPRIRIRNGSVSVQKIILI